MYWLDTTILALLVLAALLGAWSGFVRQLVRLVAFAAALAASLGFNDRATACVQPLLEDAPEWAPRLLAYVGVFCVVWLAFFLVALGLERGMQEARLQWLNRLLGAALGALKAALVLGLALLAASAYLEQPGREVVQKSACAPYLEKGARMALTVVPAEYRERVQEQLPAPAHGGLINLPALAGGS